MRTIHGGVVKALCLQPFHYGHGGMYLVLLQVDHECVRCGLNRLTLVRQRQGPGVEVRDTVQIFRHHGRYGQLRPIHKVV